MQETKMDGPLAFPYSYTHQAPLLTHTNPQTRRRVAGANLSLFQKLISAGTRSFPQHSHWQSVCIGLVTLCFIRTRLVAGSETNQCAPSIITHHTSIGDENQLQALTGGQEKFEYWGGPSWWVWFLAACPTAKKGVAVFFLGYGRCRTVARSLHEHKQSKRHLYKDPEGPKVQANHNKPKTTQDTKTTRKSPNRGWTIYVLCIVALCTSTYERTLSEAIFVERSETRTALWNAQCFTNAAALAST